MSITLKPLASIGASYRVNPVRDLRPICANCHAVVHRREPPYTVDEAQAMVRRFGEDEAQHTVNKTGHGGSTNRRDT